jgi:SAM-dependent methyltransferase
MKMFNPLHDSLVERYIINLVKTEIRKNGKGSVLDIGCGEKPFFPDLEKQVDLYIGLDHPQTPHAKKYIDVFGLAEKLPFGPEKYDLVLLTQVLEHVEEPKIVLKEINYVLKCNGVLIVSFPFLYPVHEAPRDFYRYTGYGIKYLAKETGFVIEKIEPVSGFWITFFGFLSIYILRKSKVLYKIFFPLLLLFKFICILFEKLDKSSKNNWTWNYYSVLRKG